MRAIVSRTYGSPDVARIEDVPTPIPKDIEVLIRNFATVVSGAESTARKGDSFAGRLYFGLTRPRLPILGTSFAGEVEAVGTAVTKFRVGDQVMGSVGPRMGAHAELVCTSEDGIIVIKPSSLSFSDAVAIFDGALTALPFLRDTAHLTRGQSILINGASGAVGTAAVQLAKHLGAVVTAVTSTANVDLVKSLGADHVIDYTKENFTKSGRTYDVVFDTVGKSSYRLCRSLLRANGIYLTTVVSPAILVQMLWTKRIGAARAAIAFTGLRSAPAMAQDVAYMGNLADAGAYVPVIDRSYTMEEASAAHAHVETGRKKGSVVVTFAAEA
ncbi:NAD(P)-dependent alcohol dehydrogenase [Cryobacterium sp. TMT2-15-1]|uniref:NAD(P)-dependent alcohol dehydrogenase n=1 Tax=Cryobacterium sp. TMT2-15-1 TaxID=1259246 RepID=UPI0010692E9F|nr:NAD(P)-dependent alcohol dehydrogenase [Cryobacterium sp. TMT2-15-1]TFC55448.1 NAD(P)-dependent alcohol dehydrogenase [Cryobacterium sp. TMT2-15-1]